MISQAAEKGCGDLDLISISRDAGDAQMFKLRSFRRQRGVFVDIWPVDHIHFEKESRQRVMPEVMSRSELLQEIIESFPPWMKNEMDQRARITERRILQFSDRIFTEDG